MKCCRWTRTARMHNDILERSGATADEAEFYVKWHESELILVMPSTGNTAAYGGTNRSLPERLTQQGNPLQLVRLCEMLRNSSHCD